MTNPKALVAMSGGVDSSVAALLLQEQGFDCAGAMMKLYQHEDTGAPMAKTCGSADDAEDARAVARKLGIPFDVFDFTEDFKIEVMDRFIKTYQQGKTPNPCIDCNRHLKFGRFLRRADELAMDVIATGHYARITQDGSGRYLLRRGLDHSKDQSYVLYAMKQAQLARTLLPLGALTKTQVRELAREHGFLNAAKRDSQDICFVPNGDYAAFITRTTGQACPPGRFITTDGRDLGPHKGIIHYTVGQRKGLGLALPAPLYVCRLEPDTRAVVLGENAALYTKTVQANDINLIALDRIDGPLKVTAKLRYKQPEQPATVWQEDDDMLRVEFDEPQRAAAKGQALVIYDGDVVIGGGTIC